MQIQNPDLMRKLEKLSSHYKNSLASPYFKGELPALTLSRRDWDEIELVTDRLALFEYQGFHFDDLYLKLLSLARFVRQARVQLGPCIRARVVQRFSSRPYDEKICAEIAACNFLPNVAALCEMVLELFYLVRKEDSEQNLGKPRALASVPEAREIETLLLGYSVRNTELVRR